MAKRSKITQMAGPHSLILNVKTVALGADDELVLMPNRSGAKMGILSVQYTPDTAVTGNTTNTLKLQVRNKGTAGSGTTGVTAIKTYATGTDLTAFKGDALVMSSTDADTKLDIDETLSLNKTEAGTGLALPAGQVTITFEYE